MDELTKDFLAESFEGLDRMDRCLTELEERPKDADLLGEIFRAVHTIKGTTGFLGFARLEKLAHAGENLLGSVRDGRVPVTGVVVSGLLQLMDGLRAILQLIERTGTEGVRAEDHDAGLIAHMEELHTNWLDRSAHSGPVSAPELGGTPGSAPGNITGVNEKTLRIDVDVLNRMMNLVGELVLTRNQMLQSQVDSANFPHLARRLDSVTADLRQTVMQARMQPVGHVFGKFPRMVRDLARNCGKRVRLEVSGQGTGLDKSLLEAIKDPLTHAVRNSVDHGIEEPAERAAQGKPLEGVVTLRACHRNGYVVIEVRDDGAGISTERVLAKALDRDMITEEQASQMSAREALQLIFLPGFSTAAAVTHVSGRGVGMDVVRANVEKVGGTVEIESKVGAGTVLRLRVPLTLAIVPVLVVGSGGQSFCLPQGSLAELVYVPQREAESAVERIGEARLFRLRDRLLPLVWLTELLHLPATPQPREYHGFYVAVLEVDGCRYGLVVEDLMAPEEIVVKPLSPVLREIGLFSGATILGSGMLAMILDVQAAASRAGVRAESEKKASADEAKPGPALMEAAPAFLIFEDRVSGGKAERRALPLHAVERIESVPLSDVEFANGQAMLQYRGETLHLEDTSAILSDPKRREEPIPLTVLICTRASRSPGGEQHRYGLIVSRVLDVADGSMLEEIEVSGERLALIRNRLTVVQGESAPFFHLKEVA